MTAAASQVAVPAPRLEPDAISVAQDTFIGAALVGPSVSVALTLAALAAATAYAGPAVLALTAIPMIVIANTYRRLNLWNANCGASFEWVGRAINPYLGFYLLSTSIASAFSDVINITGLLYASFYVLTALAAIVYYRRRIISDAKELLTLGILPLGAITFLVWVIVKTVTAAPRVQNESLAGVIITGLVLMLVARFGMKSPFFQVPRESDHSRHGNRDYAERPWAR